MLLWLVYQVSYIVIPSVLVLFSFKGGEMHNCRRVGKNKNNKKPQQQKKNSFRGRSYMSNHLVILLLELGLLLPVGNTKGTGLYI